MREEVAISLENIELIRCRLLYATTKWPRAREFNRVFRCKVKGANSNAQIEVAEDQLDPVVYLID